MRSILVMSMFFIIGCSTATKKIDYKQSCLNGNASHCGTYAASLSNDKESNKYYQKACDLKDWFGCYQLGMNYKFGIGVKANSFMSLSYFKKSCDLRPGMSINPACSNIEPEKIDWLK